MMRWAKVLLATGISMLMMFGCSELQDDQPSTVQSLEREACETCHAMGGTIAGRGPIVAGQWVPYLKVAVRHSSTGEHLVPRVMEDRLNKFSPEEVDALLNFYASQQKQ